jgi:pSer/pThr/pTyr-binding forkhead associated (FHA) protein
MNRAGASVVRKSSAVATARAARGYRPVEYPNAATRSRRPMGDSVQTASYLRIWSHAGTQLLPLQGDRLTIGKDPDNELAFPDDPTMSRTHAVLSRYPAGWSVRDLGARNGTFVNGRRVWQEQGLRDQDRIQLGAAELVYCCDGRPTAETEVADRDPVPELTRRERDVLVQLCLPALEALQGKFFTRPADDRRIAEALGIGEAGVRQHLFRLYDKFGIHPGGEEAEPRRSRLANEVLRRGVVTMEMLGDAAKQQDGMAG